MSTSSIGSGEFTVLLGPSGCGKSTLLSAIAGLEEIQARRVLSLAAVDVTHVEPAKRDIAMVFQSYALYPHHDGGRQHVVRPARQPDAQGGDRRAGSPMGRAPACKSTEPARPQAKSGQLSGGQRQRVAIGRALVRKTPVYLFDEPLSNLDAKLRTEMRVEIKRLHQTLSATMIYVTHDQIEAMTLATHIAIMRGRCCRTIWPSRKICISGQPRLFVAGFIGSPSMNFLPGTLSPQWRRRRLGAAGPWRRSTGGRCRWLCRSLHQRSQARSPSALRPEDIELVSDGPALEGKTLFVEPMGADSLAWFDVAGHRVSVRLEGR